jgi:tRNA-specific 2-thiouridylase
MSRNGKVVVAMSGGVDSSVAAAWLKEHGYQCIGVFMRLGSEPERSDAAADGSTCAPRRLRHGCCSTTDAIDARAVAARLGIPFYVLNFRREFDEIVDYVVDEYAAARTPNPCIACNMRLKFGRLLNYADVVDAEFLATGHYARVIERGAEGVFEAGAPVADGAQVRAQRRPCLARALHRAKDQSYVLFGIGRDLLPRCRFPIGGMADKRAVRELAAGLGLRVHDKPDSQEICFVPDGDYRVLLERRRPEALRPGAIRDGSGAQVGAHAGVPAYTIGQRRGLGAFGRPMYVTQLNVLRNEVVIGPREELLSDGLIAERMNWLVDPAPPGSAIRAAVQIRHHHAAAPASFRLDAQGCVSVRFDAPQLAVTPGQAAVLYDGEIVLGGGWISAGASGRGRGVEPRSRGVESERVTEH